MRPIIIEGPDGAGKSTLLAQLERDLGRPGIHTGGAAQSKGELQARCFEQLNQLRQGVILDRTCFISDPIYKIALGIPLIMEPFELRTWLKVIDPVIIYCRLGSEKEMLAGVLEVAKAHKPPEYLQRVKDQFPKILAGYDREMGRLIQEGFTLVKYNWKTGDYHALKETLQSCAV